ncbi:hypothetical protein ACFFS2_08815 [Streptomyces aurantiacus]|uniref:Uncharacterized protein n=1 Tax=Streptomyces aurantiacus TaxID=47760 RepID=A0A7G1NV91_9ACTN|nr:hypothetical protein [Streptomyces aurantiacus]BCL25517.1 hypothetical protein GCM10017557_03760 [Streptomyces aurantiacus]
MPTTYETTDLPAWPVYALTVRDDGRVDASGPLVPAAGHPNRASAIDTVAAAAVRLGRPVRADATEPDGAVWHLVISPDGTVGELPGDGQRARAPKRRTEKPDRTENPATEPAAARVPAVIDETADARVPASVPARAVEADVPRPEPAVTPSVRPDPPAATGSSYEPVPLSTSHFGPAAASTGLAPEAGPPAGTGAYAKSLALVTDLLQAGHVDEAAALVARLDEQASGDLGISHPDALRIREIRARVTALAGNAVAGVLLFRDVAERWHYQGDAEQAEAAAVRAETLWLQITDLDPALSAGIAVVRLRNQIPGEGGESLAAALEHKTWLEAATGAAHGRPPRQHAAAVPSGGARTRSPALSWERPAQETPTAM